MISRANIILTHGCNLKCKHCYIDAKNCKEDHQSIYKKTIKVLDQLKVDNVNNVMFTGGECMIFSYLKEVIDYAKKLNMIVTIFTNGMIFNKEIFDSVDFVNISLDGPEEIHNYIRQNDKSYSNVIRVLNYLKEKDIKTTMQVTLSKLNVRNIDFLAELTLNHLNIRTVRLVFVSNSGRAKTNNMSYNQEDVDYVFNKLDDLYEKSKYHIQFVPNIINKYDFENYYLSGNLDFPLWIDIPKDNYYLLEENLFSECSLESFNMQVVNNNSAKLFKILYNNRVEIEKNKYINVEDTILKTIKGEL